MKDIGLIFDFNGTMFLDSEKQEKAWNTFIRELCNREITVEEFRYIVHGRNNKEILEYFLSKSLLINEVDFWTERKEQIYRKLCLSDLKNLHLTNGLRDLLNTIKDRNIPRTIATASRKSNVDFYIKQFHLKNWFDISNIVYDNDTFPGKPNPDIYLKASENIGVDPGYCIVFEDAVSGIQAAYKAGIGKIIAIVPNTSSQDFFMEMKEVYDVISNFHDFDRLLLRNI